jgi:hypothetical protein
MSEFELQRTAVPVRDRAWRMRIGWLLRLLGERGAGERGPFFS